MKSILEISRAARSPLLMAVMYMLSSASWAEVDSRILIDSSVRIFCKKADGIGTGSGFLVGQAGKHVLTNSHVAGGCQQIVVMSPRDVGEPKKIQAKVIWDSKSSVGKSHLDASLLVLEESADRKGVRFASKVTVALNDKVIAVGYPGAADSVGGVDALVKPTITMGTISRMFVRRNEGVQAGTAGVGVYQVTAPIGPGNSGGPLFNEFGEVIAINTEKSLVATAGLTEDGVGVVRVPLGEGIAWSQEVDELLPVLRENGIDFTLRTQRRNWFWSWIDRDPVTASVLGVIGLLLLSVLGYLTYRHYHRPHIPKPEPIPSPKPRAAKAVVRGVEGPFSGNKFPLDSDLVFGRDAKSCGVVFLPKYDGISGRHCSIRFDEATGNFYLRDIGSTNGTYVNGRQLKPGEIVPLRNGDEFYLFKPKYRFVVELETRHSPDGENTTAGAWRPGGV